MRIYKKDKVLNMLKTYGFKCWKINYKHALHVPYWWIKCLVGYKNESNLLVKYYKSFWNGILCINPFLVRF